MDDSCMAMHELAADLDRDNIKLENEMERRVVGTKHKIDLCFHKVIQALMDGCNLRFLVAVDVVFVYLICFGKPDSYVKCHSTVIDSRWTCSHG